MLCGLSGKIGSGKNTVSLLIADFLHEKFPIYNKSFAFKLKQIVEILTNFKMEISLSNNFSNGITDFSRDDKNVYISQFDMTIGEMLQQIGTNVFRDNFDREIWIKSLFTEYGDYEKKNVLWIVTDVRFTNEANYIKEKNGILIRINGFHLKEENTRNKFHPSETALDDYNKFDYIIENTGSLGELESKVKEIINLEFNN
jgi:hypothetical protein